MVGNDVNPLFVAKLNQERIIKKGPRVDFDNLWDNSGNAGEFFQFLSVEIRDANAGDRIGLVGQNFFEGLPALLPGVFWIQMRRRTNGSNVGRKIGFLPGTIHPRDFVVAPRPVQQEVEFEVDPRIIIGLLETAEHVLDGQERPIVSEVCVPHLGGHVDLDRFFRVQLAHAFDDSLGHQKFVLGNVGSVDQPYVLVVSKAVANDSGNHVGVHISDAHAHQRK
mmetsp:Transcript_1620/g.3771  ORF Transcript_1620/g.3771 Transcript_1620/m.3771 type:complete len:222 (+) Transcript_1620:690-1355(+)